MAPCCARTAGRAHSAHWRTHVCGRGRCGRTSRLAAFTQTLKQLGWSDGRNLRIDTRWATADDIRRHAAELAALAPDVLVAGTGTPTVAPLLQATRTVPIVFALVIDPVGAGFVASLAHPGGIPCTEGSVRANPSAVRVDGWPRSQDRNPSGWGRSRQHSPLRGGTGRTHTGRDF
jgi:ABC transporter substrate binding protein